MTAEYVFEVIALISLALGSTLMMFVSQRTMQAPDAFRIQLLLNSFMGSLLYFYIPQQQATRFSLAVAAIPVGFTVANNVYAYIFVGGTGVKSHAP